MSRWNSWLFKSKNQTEPIRRLLWIGLFIILEDYYLHVELIMSLSSLGFYFFSSVLYYI